MLPTTNRSLPLWFDTVVGLCFACTTVYPQSLLKFLERNRRVIYVNEFRTSKCCARCKAELRQVSNRCVREA